MNLTLDDAQAIIDRARAHATAIGVPMNIAVVDGGGHLLAYARMDKAILGSIGIALTKAKTSILFNSPSEPLGVLPPRRTHAGYRAHQRRSHPQTRRMAVHDDDGSLIGAIGVSGCLPEQDGEVAPRRTAGGANSCP